MANSFGFEMNSENLSRLCTGINNASDQYGRNVKGGIDAITAAFNANWCSNSAQELADEISRFLDEITARAQNLFSEYNSNIRNVVNAFNQDEKENINFSGFSWVKPLTTIKLNSTLPNGNKGVLEGGDLLTIAKATLELSSKITEDLESAKSAVAYSGAFNSSKLADATTSIDQIKNHIVNRAQDLVEQLDARIQGETDNKIKLGDAASKLFTEYFSGE